VGAVSNPRLLVIMGSGETSPTMVKTHRSVLDRVGRGPAVVLDTPFGFQENADEIAAKALAYFRESVGTELSVATYRSHRDDDTVTYESMLARLREANYVFAGPGSPSYALEQWRESSVPAVLSSKLREGGAITFASAAALVLGTHTVPVYEIYKVGQEPHWLDGLDLVADARLRAAVIPHYDNAEGGTHDTRYSYLGERRLQQMEEQLPADVFILGVDEHTACILDLDADTATITGLGAVTILEPEDQRVVDPPAHHLELDSRRPVAAAQELPHGAAVDPVRIGRDRVAVGAPPLHRASD
jgi:cyanophycinase-like exopeptidase